MKVKYPDMNFSRSERRWRRWALVNLIVCGTILIAIIGAAISHGLER